MIGYDWRETFSPAKAESELCDEQGNGFKFKGPGWYQQNKDILLCLPNPSHKDLYDFYIWNAPESHPREQFNVFLAALPTYVFDGKK